MFEGTLAYPGTPTPSLADVVGRWPTPHAPATAPCPWCGSKGTARYWGGRAPWAVVCAGCEARGPTATTPGEAVERWDAYAAPAAGGAH